jgi:hypothetical protein
MTEQNKQPMHLADLSPADMFRLLPREERKRRLDQMSDEDLARLRYKPEFWEKPDRTAGKDNVTDVALEQRLKKIEERLYALEQKMLKAAGVPRHGNGNTTGYHVEWSEAGFSNEW